jgi:sugar phosphate isomerase/epimerase
VRLGIRLDRILKQEAPVRDATLLARNVGFTCIEIAPDGPDYPIEEVAEESVLPVASVCIDWWPHHKWRHCSDNFKKQADVAVDKGAQIVIADTREFGPFPVLYAVLGYMNVENIALVELIYSPGETLSFLGKHPNVNICYDIGNDKSMYINTREFLRDVGDRIKFVHLKHRDWGRETTYHLPPLGDKSTGTWYLDCLKEIHEQGYDGPVILETPAGDENDLRRNYERAKSYLEPL